MKCKLKSIMAMALCFSMFTVNVVPTYADEVISIEQEQEESSINLNVENMTADEYELFMKIVDEEVERVADIEYQNGNTEFNKEEFKQEVLRAYNRNGKERLHVPVSNKAVASAVNTYLNRFLGE